MTNESELKKKDLYERIKEPLPPVLSKTSTFAGSFWVIIFFTSLLFIPDHLITIIIFGTLLALILVVTGRLPFPRNHQAAMIFFLLFIFILIYSLFYEADSDHDSLPVLPVVFSFLIVFSIVSLLRTTKSLWIGWFSVMTLGVAFSLLHLIGYKWNVGYPGFTTEILLVLFGAPLVLSLRGWKQRIGFLFLAIIFVSACFHALKPGSFSLVIPQYADIIEFFVIIILLSSILRQGYKDLKRWKTPCISRSLYLSGMLSAVFFPILVIMQGWTLNENMVYLTAALLGIGLAGRERLIHEDFTRHPRRRQTHIYGYFQETGIFFESLIAAIISIFRSGHEQTRHKSQSKIIDSDSNKLYFPYQTGTPNWIPVCMHLHTNYWEGAFNADEVADYYARLGAKAVIITDHNRITTSSNSVSVLPAYEHGWGFYNHHVLALGAKKALPDESIFGKSQNLKRRQLASLRKNSDFLILAHPMHKDAWSEKDVSNLDYDALEIFNKSIESVNRWDEALSSGRLVWGTAGDDCHDLRSRHQTAKRYILVDIRDEQGLTAETLIKALRKGAFIAVWQRNRNFTSKLPPDDLPLISSFDQYDDTLKLIFDKPVDKVTLIGKNGVMIKELKSVEDVEILLPGGSGYIRAEIRHDMYSIMLNPIARIKEFPVEK
ncbi:MAG: hypothetical protein P9L92_15120 [Candidatus Electryonea clarkiae]|nr:hypothetical protein [Candidatus Electryonea clarkiae]MDP8288951.1 hypothetical protein [Candidatus Electryonea clarkiae]